MHLAETIAIREWAWGVSDRYSDACDYVMQCMYEENSLLAPGKPYWFDPVDKDILFWILRRPGPVSAVTSGFRFPDLDARNDRNLQAELEALYEESKYFAAVKLLMKDEVFMFVRADTAGAQDANLPSFYPLRVQLDIKCTWQPLNPEA